MAGVTGSYVVLIIIAAVALALSIISAIYVLVYWSEKTEVWKTLLPRMFIVFSLTLVYFVPLIIPMDVTIKYLSPDLDFMNIVWQVFLYVIIAMAAVVLPFTLFYLDEKINEQKCGKTCMCAICQSFVSIFVIAVFAIILYFTIGEADLKMPLYNQPEGLGQSYFGSIIEKSTDGTELKLATPTTYTHVYLPLSFATYLIAIFAFLGAIFFTVFFSIGLAALPLDWINIFKKRPKVMSKQQLIQFRSKMALRANQFIEQIDAIYAALLKVNFNGDTYQMRIAIESNNKDSVFKKQRQLRNQFEKIKKQTMTLNDVYKEIILMNQKETANPLKYFARLIVGVFAMLFSLLIYAQLIAVMINQFNPLIFKTTENVFFLGLVLKKAQEAINVPLISVLIFAIFSLYITFCFVKGVTKFGFRFIMFISIHPMKMGQTELNSFIFNTILMTMGILPLLQFLTYIFKEFSYGSAVDLLFGQSVSNIRYLKEFFNWYIVAMCIIFFLSLIYLLMCPGEDVYDSLDSILKSDKEHGESRAKGKRSKHAKKELKAIKMNETMA
ncbi:LMBR1-like_membrane protein [Hexamita inflata]|uniref:LMBR1-like membrane protein n=1 Tax=Hexamita inflata TaxID=28002 RepID=A0AA86QS66_9EUKA|nr:LMBR1-like membrane protein [Hexamita inflata]